AAKGTASSCHDETPSVSFFFRLGTPRRYPCTFRHGGWRSRTRNGFLSQRRASSRSHKRNTVEPSHAIARVQFTRNEFHGKTDDGRAALRLRASSRSSKHAPAALACAAGCTRPLARQPRDNLLHRQIDGCLLATEVGPQERAAP